MKDSLRKAIQERYGTPVSVPAHTAPVDTDVVDVIEAPVATERIDLSALITRPQPIAPPATEPETGDVDAESAKSTDKPTEAEQEPGELIEESVAGVRTMVEGMLGQAIDNSDDLAEIILVGITMFRQHMLYPWASMKFVFSATDQERLKVIIPKLVDFEAMGKSDEAVPIKKDAEYETDEDKQLVYRFSQYQKHRRKVPYKPSEEKLIKSVIQKKLAGVSVGDFLAKYDWLIALAFIEGSRILPLIGMKQFNPLSQFD